MNDDTEHGREREPIFRAPWPPVVLALTLVGLRLFPVGSAEALAFDPQDLFAGQVRGLVTHMAVASDWPTTIMLAVIVLACGTAVGRALSWPLTGPLGFFAFFIVCGVLGAVAYALTPGAGVLLAGAAGGALGLAGAGMRLMFARTVPAPMGHSRTGLMSCLALAAIVVAGAWLGGSLAQMAWMSAVAGLVAGYLLIEPFMMLFHPRHAI